MIKTRGRETMVQRALRAASESASHVSLQTGDNIALMGIAFFVGMIVQKVWSYGVVACWWPV